MKDHIGPESCQVGRSEQPRELQFVQTLQRPKFSAIVKDGLHLLIRQIGVVHELRERGVIDIELPHLRLSYRFKPYGKAFGQSFHL